MAGEDVDKNPSGTGDGADELERLRAENARLQEELTKKQSRDPAVVSAKRRRRASVTLAVIAAILLPLAVLTVWTRNSLLRTDQYLETVAPLADDPAIQNAVAEKLTTNITEALDFEEYASELLPEQAQPLAGIIAGGAESLIRQVADRVVRSDQFSDLWRSANEKAHERVKVLLTGGSTDLVDTARGTVTIDLGELSEQAVDQLADTTGINLSGLLPSGGIGGDYVLFQSEELARIQGMVKWFDRLALFLTVGFVASAVGAVFAAQNRREGVRRSGIAIIAATVGTIAAVAFAREIYGNTPFDNPQAALNAFDMITNFLRMTLRALLALGVVMVAGAWLFGPTRSAVRVRGWGQIVLSATDDKFEGRDLGPVPVFLKAQESVIRWVTIGLGVAWILYLDHPTGITVILIALLCGAVIGGVHLVASLARDGSGGGDGGEIAATPEPDAPTGEGLAVAATSGSGRVDTDGN